MTDQTTDAPSARTRSVSFTHSESFPEVLAAASCSLLVSTYQAGQVVSMGTHEGGLHLGFRRFAKAMGVAYNGERLAIGDREQIWYLEQFPEVAPQLPPAGRFDRLFLPRTTAVTGNIQGHEMAWGTGADGEPELWIVNTAFSCLAGLDGVNNFVPRWRPPFITAMAAEDRCHLNGLAMRDGKPAYVTMMAATDAPAGWRQLPKNSGLVMDVASGAPVAVGLTMPHSPRWHRDQLFVLNSGTGCLETVDHRTGAREVVEPMPGFTRGLGVHGNLAFVGLSKVRETSTFGGIPLAEYHDQLKCGVGVIDLDTGRTVATFEFLTGVEEIFDVQVVPDTRCVSLGGNDEDEVWVLPASAR